MSSREQAHSNARPCHLCKEFSGTRIFRKNGYDLHRCRQCGLTYVAEPPTRKELEKLYSFESGYHTELVADSETIRRGKAKAARCLRILTEQRKPGRVLDVGCGPGFFLEAAREAGWETAGVELSKDTAKLAREKRGLDVSIGSLEEAEFPSGSFDVVTMWDLIEHVEDPLALLETARRLLKKEGLIILITPNLDGLFPRASYRIARWTRVWRHPEPPYHLFQFSKSTIGIMLERAGFRQIGINHRAIPLRYSFGPLRRVIKRPKFLAYAAAFAPLVIAGPLVAAGDEIVVVAQRES